MTSHTFGPGALESITLTTRPESDKLDHPIHHAAGEFMVYCGHGNSHAVAIDIQDDAAGHANAAHDEVAMTLVGYALEDYLCPCEDGEDITTKYND